MRGLSSNELKSIVTIIKNIFSNFVVILKCHIRTYKDWLQDNEFPPPTCGLCKKHLEESEADDVIRFLCLGNYFKFT